MAARIDMVVDGIDVLRNSLVAAPREVRIASVAATKASQALIARRVRSNMNGPYRWGHRGKSRIYKSNVNISKVRRAGGSGVGKFTGALRKGVGGKKKISPEGDTFVGGVGVGGATNNLKKRAMENRFKFFSQGNIAAQAEVAATYETSWQKAIAKAWGNL